MGPPSQGSCVSFSLGSSISPSHKRDHGLFRGRKTLFPVLLKAH